VAFNPDGSRLASVSDDKTVVVYSCAWGGAGVARAVGELVHHRFRLHFHFRRATGGAVWV